MCAYCACKNGYSSTLASERETVSFPGRRTTLRKAVWAIMDRALVVKSGTSGDVEGRIGVGGVGGRKNALVPVTGVSLAPLRACGEDLVGFERRWVDCF
jgi:hypothetical protein